MVSKRYAAIALCLVPFQLAGAASPDAAVVHYVSPDGVPALPAKVVTALKAEGCKIPKQDEDLGAGKGSSVYGEFARNGQIDWAVLCSKNGKSKVMVFWGGPAICKGLPAGERADAVGRALETRKVDRQALEQGGVHLATGATVHDALYEQSASGESSELYCYHGEWNKLS